MFIIKAPAFVVVFAVLAANIYDLFVGEPPLDEHCRMTEQFQAKKGEFVAQSRSAFVLGATGEVGKEVVKALLTDRIFSRVVLIGRRVINYEEELYKDVEQRVIDFDKLEDHVEAFKGFDVCYSCLGTTRAKSGADGFYKVDHDYVVNTAKLAKDHGVTQLHLVSAVGSDKNSSFLYARTKGEVEEELKALKFENLFIYRPGLLLCDREERRAGEKAITILMKPMTTLFPTVMSVPTATVARAMINRTLTAATPGGEEGGARAETLCNKGIHQAAKCE